MLEDYLDNPDNIPGTWSVDGPDDSALIAGSVFSDQRLSGTYTFTFSFTNPFGGSCTNSISESLEFFDPPSATVAEEEFACNGTNITVYPTSLNLDNYVIGASGEWSAPSDFNGGVIDDVTNVDFLDVVPGTYTFTFTTNDAIAPCENISYGMDIIVRNCNCPSVNFIPPTPLCNDGPMVDLNDYLPQDAPEGFWSFINGTPEVTLLNGSNVDISVLEGFYLFQYTLNEVPEGCPDFGQISLEVVAPPEVVHVPELDVCNVDGPQAELCIDLNELVDGVDGSWTIDPTYNGDASDISNICFDSEMAGEVLFFIYNTESGQLTCDERNYTTQINVLDCNCPNLELLDAPNLCASDGTFDLSTLLTNTTAPGSWSDGVNLLNNSEVLQVTGNIADLSNTVEGGSVYQFTYTPDETPTANCDQFSLVNISVSTEPVFGGLTNEPTCIESGTTIDLLSYVDIVSMSASPSFYLNDQLLPFIGSIYTWTADVVPGKYKFKVVMEGGACPSDSIEYDIIVGPTLSALANPSPCAEFNEGSIIVSSIDVGSGLLYSIDGGQTWTSESEFNNLAPGTYNVMVEDEYGCQWEVETLVVTEPEELTVFAGEDRQIEEDAGATNLMISSNIDLSLLTSVVWTEDGTVICSGDANQCASIDVNPDGVAEYCVIITDVNGCVSEDCVIIRERIVKDVYLANVFSTSQAGNNDIFFVQGDQYVETVNEFRIYDRWGNMVFEAEPNHVPNDKSYGWDGTMNDQFVEQGVYVYTIRITFTDGEEEYFVGDITLIKE